MQRLVNCKVDYKDTNGGQESVRVSEISGVKGFPHLRKMTLLIRLNSCNYEI